MTLATNASVSIFIWSVVLIAVVLVGFLAVALVKRKLQQPDIPEATAAGFSLEELRRMHRDGQLTDDEFARARDRLIGKKQSDTPKSS